MGACELPPSVVSVAEPCREAEYVKQIIKINIVASLPVCPYSPD